MQHFVDASNNQRTLDFVAIRHAGAVGVYHKVSEGPRFIDRFWSSRRWQARRAGLSVGGYHFGHPDADPVAQADHFLELLGRLHRGDLLPCLDLEVSDGKSSAQVFAWAHAFLSHVHEKTGAWPVLYSGEYFMKENGLDRLPGRKWVAKYSIIEPALRWDAWQVSDGAYEPERSILHLDTSWTPHIALLQYRPPVRKKVSASVRRAALRAWIRGKRRAGWGWKKIKKTSRWKAYHRLGGK